MAVHVRLAEPEEFDEIGCLTVQSYAADGVITVDHPYSTVLLDAAGRAVKAELWVASQGSDLLGTVTWCLPGSLLQEVAGAGEGEFRALAVAPRHQGRGVGRLLVEHCLDLAETARLDAVALSSGTWMTAAHRLYERLGFRRLPEADWTPVSGVCLLAYRRPRNTPRLGRAADKLGR